MIDYNGN